MSIFSHRFDCLTDLVYLPLVMPPTSPDVRGVDDSVLDLIYCVDPRTGFPCGDFQQFVNENTRPEIADFIQKELFKDMSQPSPFSLPQDQINSLNETVTDDDVAFAVRWKDESPREYALRMENYLRDQKRAYLKSLKDEKPA